MLREKRLESDYHSRGRIRLYIHFPRPRFWTSSHYLQASTWGHERCVVHGLLEFICTWRTSCSCPSRSAVSLSQNALRMRSTDQRPGPSNYDKDGSCTAQYCLILCNISRRSITTGCGAFCLSAINVLADRVVHCSSQRRLSETLATSIIVIMTERAKTGSAIQSVSESDANLLFSWIQHSA